MTRRLLLVGIGAGDPDQLTVEAVRALNEADVFLVADKAAGAGLAETADLVALREEVLRRHATRPHRVVAVPDPARSRAPMRDGAYGCEVRDWHAARARAYAKALVEQTGPGETVGLLVWGDPCLYDSTIRVVERVRDTEGVDLEYRVVPGVSSIHVLAARHRLVLNRIGSSITVTTGRRLAAEVAAGADNLVVMLDGGLACADLVDAEAGPDWDIWWGANLGTEDEELVSGRLSHVIGDVRAARARAKAARGWVMDTYLLRRRAAPA